MNSLDNFVQTAQTYLNNNAIKDAQNLIFQNPLSIQNLWQAVAESREVNGKVLDMLLFECTIEHGFVDNYPEAVEIGMGNIFPSCRTLKNLLGDSNTDIASLIQELRKDSSPCTLYFFARNADAPLFEAVVDKAPELFASWLTTSPLGIVILFEKVSVEKRKLLLERNEKGQTPLHRAAENGHHAAVKMLLRESIPNKRYDTLEENIQNAFIESRRAILATSEAQDLFSRVTCLTTGSSQFIYGLLLSFSAAQAAFYKYHGDINAFIAANSARDALLAERPVLLSADNDGKTPLYVSAEAGHTDIVLTFLKEAKAEEISALLSPDKQGRTIAHVAAKCGNITLLHLLVENISTSLFLEQFREDEDGNTPMDVAKQCGHLDTVVQRFFRSIPEPNRLELLPCLRPTQIYHVVANTSEAWSHVLNTEIAWENKEITLLEALARLHLIVTDRIPALRKQWMIEEIDVHQSHIRNILNPIEPYILAITAHYQPKEIVLLLEFYTEQQLKAIIPQLSSETLAMGLKQLAPIHWPSILVNCTTRQKEEILIKNLLNWPLTLSDYKASWKKFLAKQDEEGDDQRLSLENCRAIYLSRLAPEHIQQQIEKKIASAFRKRETSQAMMQILENRLSEAQKAREELITEYK